MTYSFKQSESYRVVASNRNTKGGHFHVWAVTQPSGSLAGRRASKNAFLVQFDATMMPDSTRLSWSTFERGISYDRKTAKM
jgi:hypothetical protein